MAKVTHRDRGECEVWGEYDSHLILVDRTGNKFQAVRAEINYENVVSLHSHPRAGNEALPYPDSEKVHINLITERELNKKVNGFGVLRARYVINNRPTTGYTDLEQMKTLNPDIPAATWTTLSDRNVLVFDALP